MRPISLIYQGKLVEGNCSSQVIWNYSQANRHTCVRISRDKELEGSVLRNDGTLSSVVVRYLPSYSGLDRGNSACISACENDCKFKCAFGLDRLMGHEDRCMSRPE
jgi:hypothetical protein